MISARGTEAGRAEGGRRVAAIDCGTNTVRLLVADLHTGPDGAELHDVRREMRIVRLGENVDRTGVLGPDALRRTETALHEYADLIAGDGVSATRLVATSATRDAANRADFVRMVQNTLGVTPEVVSGTEEAGLSFAGAVRGLPQDRPVLVVDIGGGSTEFVLGRAAVDAAVSVDVGSVRLTERYFDSDPPTAEALDRARADIERALVTVRTALTVPHATRLVGVAGTVTTLVAMALGLPSYDPLAIHHAVVPADRLRAVIDRTVRADRAARSAEPALHPGRVDVIAAGALILEALLVELGSTELTASETDILDAIALTLR